MLVKVSSNGNIKVITSDNEIIKSFRYVMANIHYFDSHSFGGLYC